MFLCGSPQPIQVLPVILKDAHAFEDEVQHGVSNVTPFGTRVMVRLTLFDGTPSLDERRQTIPVRLQTLFRHFP